MLEFILLILFLIVLLYFSVGFKGIRLLIWIVAVMTGVLWLMDKIAT